MPSVPLNVKLPERVSPAFTDVFLSESPKNVTYKNIDT